MSIYTPPVTRVPTRYGHYYRDAVKQRIPGVTTILNGGIPKPQLIDWAGNKSAELAVDNWDDLADMKPLARVEWIKQARKKSENLVKNRGTRVHAIAEAVVQGEPAEFESDDEEHLLRPYVENYIRFIDLWKVDPHLVEVVIANYTIGYAGTLDLVAWLQNPHSGGERELWLLDIKTGEKGIWAETALQLAAYRQAETYIDNQGIEIAFPTIEPDHCAAINVTADDAVLVPVVADDQAFKIFRHAKAIYTYDKDKDGYVQPPLAHPRASTATITWEDSPA